MPVGWGQSVVGCHTRQRKEASSFPSRVCGLSEAHSTGDLLFLFFCLLAKQESEVTLPWSLLTETATGGKDTRLSGLLPLSNIVTRKKQNRGKTEPACEAWRLDLSSLDRDGESSFVFLFITGTKVVIQRDPFWILDPSGG